MAFNHDQVVYIPKGEHDDPHELPKQQELEGSTETEHDYIHMPTLKYLKQIHFKNLSISTSIFKTMKNYMNQIPIYLALKSIILYIHILTTILSMVYSKMSLVVII